MKYFETRDYKKRDEEFKIIADKLDIFGDDLLIHFLDFSLNLKSTKCGYDVIINSMDSSVGILYRLVLKNCSTDNTEIDIDWFELSQLTEYEFRLEVADGESKVVCFDFTEAVIEKQAVNAFCDIPTITFDTRENEAEAYFSRVSEAIVCHDYENLSTDCEKAVLPLAKFLGHRSDEIPDLFWNLAEKHGVTDLVKKYKDNKYKLLDKLLTSKYKELWTEIYNILYDSQKGIPTLIQLLGKEEQFAELQDSVTSNFRKAGFNGEYPCYYNNKGFVYCFEDCYGEEVHIQQYDCFKAKEPFKIPAYFEALLLSDEHIIVSPYFFNYEEISTDEIVALSVKCINGDKLTKDEKKYCNGIYVGNTGLILFLSCLILSVLFGVAIILGFMLIEFIVSMIVTGFNFSIFAELFLETPWWLVGIASGALFGGTMIILAVIPYLSKIFKKIKF